MYRWYLVSLISYRDHITYDAKHIFSDVELTSISPTDVERWMNYRAYGDPEPGPDARPTKLRGSTLLVAKKAISFLFPTAYHPGILAGVPASQQSRYKSTIY
jgi:hypothetical protein